MRTVFFILACIIGWCYGLALAGTEREARIKMLMQRHPNSIFLPMPEAMVTEEKTDSKAEGLCISGDEEHVPILYWEQQDMLRIDFPEGCRYQTEYKLEFPAEKAFSLFFFLSLLPGCSAQLLASTAQHQHNHMQNSIYYLSKLQQVARESSDMRLILRRFGREPIIIPLSRENQEVMRALIAHMQPVENDRRMRPKSSYSVNLQFLDAAGTALFEFDTAAVNNGKGRAYGYLALSEEELLLWNQHVKCDAVIKHIGSP